MAILSRVKNHILLLKTAHKFDQKCCKHVSSIQSYLEVGEGSGPKRLHQLRISPTLKQPSFKFWPPGYGRKIYALVSAPHSKLIIGVISIPCGKIITF